MKALYSEQQAWFYLERSAQSPRKVAGDYEKGGMFCVIRGGQGETCYESQTFIPALFEFHGSSVSGTVISRTRDW